jgi:hypothetical protein
MLRAVWSRLVRVRVTFAYAVALSVVMVTLLLLGPKVRDRVTEYASTNLYNLAHGRIGTLLGSAFVADSELFYVWLPGLICLLAAAELLWHWRHVLLVFVTGHVGATILVAAGLFVAVEEGWLPWSITRAADVGISYGAMAITGAFTAVVPTRVKPVWLAWWLSAATAVVAISSDFTDIGHAVALVLGILISTRLDSRVYWTRTRRILFGAGTSFGYLILVHTPELALAGVPASALGAAVVAAVGLLVRRGPSL